MIEIKSKIINKKNSNEILVETNGKKQQITVATKENGYGLSTNGGEMLFLALATCYCNDIYREANKLNIAIREVQVEVTGNFQNEPGSIAENVLFNVMVDTDAPKDKVFNLLKHTDTVAEIQNTVRAGVSVKLNSMSIKQK